MATKLTFRARTLDATKAMAIYRAEDLPELADSNAINRSVPAMPSGMEKEEESEKHLQDILDAQSRTVLIPTTLLLPFLFLKSKRSMKTILTISTKLYTKQNTNLPEHTFMFNHLQPMQISLHMTWMRKTKSSSMM